MRTKRAFLWEELEGPTWKLEELVFVLVQVFC